jgi:hypothetical protein
MKKNEILQIPKDFSGACEIFNIQSIAALQFCISYMTVYLYLAKTYDRTIYLSSMILDTFLSQMKKRNKMDEYKRIVGIKYVREVLRLIMEEGNPNKADQYNALINKWYDEIKDKLPENIVKTSDGLSLSMPNDFCILCDILRCSPVKLLQYYINHISLQSYMDATEENAFVYSTEFFLQYPPITKLINAS